MKTIPKIKVNGKIICILKNCCETNVFDFLYQRKHWINVCLRDIGTAFKVLLVVTHLGKYFKMVHVLSIHKPSVYLYSFYYYKLLVHIQIILYNFNVVLGAFIPGVPVQPILLRYPNKLVREEILHSK